MLESGLFFTLGFLCSGLLALMVAPAIWRRAVVLTRQRIESSVPLTLNEIQADKDQLRAEFAMSTRRLEVSLDGLKERAAEQLIEINRRRDEVLSLEEEHQEKSNRISDLEAQAAELRAELKSNEEKLNVTSTSLASVEVQLEEKAYSFEELNQRYQQVVDDFDGQKIEIVARETRLDSVHDQAREATRTAQEKDAEKQKLASEVKILKNNMAKEKTRLEAADNKMTRLQANLADVEGRLERRESDLLALRNKSGISGDRLGQVEKDLDKANAENVKLQAEIAESALRMEALLKDASNDNIENAIATFESERKELRNQLAKAESDREALKIELSAMQMSSGEDWEVERRENAIVRERINDLAAQVTAMTASIEGPDSPINKALANEALPGQRASSTASRTQTGGSKKDVDSLADRIRALKIAADQG